jgi:hypothetical protein
MTDKQINAAIARECGWTEIRENLVGKAPGETANRVMFLPNYCGCLNAMHEAEKVYMNTPEKKIQILVQILEWWLDAVVQKRSKGTPIWHATARQRAEAFLRTLDKWEEGQ